MHPSFDNRRDFGSVPFNNVDTVAGLLTDKKQYVFTIYDDCDTKSTP